MNFVKVLIPAFFLITGVSTLEIHFLFFLNEFREGTYPGFPSVYRGSTLLCKSCTEKQENEEGHLIIKRGRNLQDAYLQLVCVRLNGVSLNALATTSKL